jgi:pimeloyl-ACP methyl ester carboxylesterase
MSTPARPKIRTNVRFYILRLALGLMSRAAPGAAERWALRLWWTPRRPRPPRPPEVPGLSAQPLTIDHAAGRVAAWSWGEGPTALLVHGWSGYAGQMASFVAPLVAAGFRVVAFDHPAHGQSGGQTVSGLGMREAVLAVGRAVGPVRALVAHSLGATAATMAQAEGLGAQRMVLIAPPAEAPVFARAFGAALGLPPARIEGMLARAARPLGGDFSRLDLRQLAPRMSTPVLVVHDPDDAEVPFAHGQAIAAAWPGARLRATRGLGHRRALRDPEIVAEVVDFVRGPVAQPRVAAVWMGSER